MRILLGVSILSLGLCSELAPARANTASAIGYNAGHDMASRLWAAKYSRDCFRSDRFLAEITQNQQGLSGSAYHQGYRQGLINVETEVAQICHSTQPGGGGEPEGECPQMGYQHGSNLGTQVCNDSIMSYRMANTCYQQALATCFDGLKKYVRSNCRNKLYGEAYHKAESECQQAFARR